MNDTHDSPQPFDLDHARIASWRTKIHASKAVAAWILGVSSQTYSRAESGAAQLPTPARQLLRSLLAYSERDGYANNLHVGEQPGPWTWAFHHRDGDRLGALIALTAAGWASTPGRKRNTR